MIKCSLEYQYNHSDLLKAMELKHDVVTQQITSQVAQKVAHQSNTGTNVCLKVCVDNQKDHYYFVLYAFLSYACDNDDFVEKGIQLIVHFQFIEKLGGQNHYIARTTTE